jgi:L-arabinokinase
VSSAIVFYVSGHGYGHASRVIEVINAILARRPETRIGVRTSAPRWLFDLTVKGRVQFSHLETDTGVVQIDSLTLDEADSIRRAAAFHADLVSRAASETRVLREISAGLVVGDIPPLAFAVGHAAGLPSIAIGNFTWDWIYADYPRVRLAPSLLPAVRGAYAKATMALRLPMHGGFDAIANVKDIPFIARHASRSRDEVVRALKLPAEKPIVVASFGGFGLPSLDADALARLKKYTVVTTSPTPLGRARKEAFERKGSFISIAEEAVYDSGVRYEDLVAAADAVVTKPGYGIVAECIANETAILYTSRGHFPEYDVIVAEMQPYVRSAFIDQNDLFAGKWEGHLDRLLAQPKPKKKPETNGADVAAEILLKTLDKPPRKPRGRAKAKVSGL